MVKRIFNFVYREVKGVHQAAYILALFSFGSQVLAVVRDRLLAHTFGAGPELDIYYAAFVIPDLLFVLFSSILSVYVLLPFVNKHKEIKSSNSNSNKVVLSQVFTLFLFIYLAVVVFLFLSIDWFLPYILPGLTEHYDTLSLLVKILLLQPFILGLSNLCGVITQLEHRFILYALSPLFYNFGIIIGIIFLYPLFGIVGLVFGVILGALGHLGIQVPFVIKSKFSFGFSKKIDWKLIFNIVKVSGPRALTLAVNQVVILFLIGLASTMTDGSVSVFKFAYNLQSVPLAIVGASYSVATFPTLSKMYSQKDKTGFNRKLLTALRHIIFWSLPITALIIVLRAHIVRILLGTGAFDWSDTRLTAAVLAVFVISLVAQSIILLLVRSLYAAGKVFIPLFSAVFSMTLTILLVFWLQNQLSTDWQTSLQTFWRLRQVVGSEVLLLAIAFSCGQFIQMIILFWFFIKSFKINLQPLFNLFIQSVLASISGMLVSYLILNTLVEGINQESFIGIFLQGAIAGVSGIITIFIVYHLLNSYELLEIKRSFKGKFGSLMKTDVINMQ